MKTATGRWTAGRAAARVILAAALLPCVVEAGDPSGAGFARHPYFKHLAGRWTSEGELKGADGNSLKIRQEWKAEILGETTLTIEGRREINGNAQNFKWTLTRDPSTGRIEAAHQPDTDHPDSQRFEVQAAEDGSRVEFTALIDNGTKVTLEESFKGPGHDAIETKVTLTDGSGGVVLSGVLAGRRTGGS